MSTLLETPSTESVRAACERFDRENALAEQTLSELFQQYPRNDDLRHVLLKVIAVNSLYHTCVYALDAVARHIHAHGAEIDAALEAGSHEIVDKIATAIWLDSTCFYVNFYRTTEQGRFTPHEATRLSRLAPALTAIVARHCREEDVAEAPMTIESLFAAGEQFKTLTPREKEVCQRILSGYGSAAISAELGISLHSTFTYRKRAYEKLGICSQNELFAIALRLMAVPRRAH